MFISIHASAKEATKFDMLGLKTLSISIHASAKEATPKSFVLNFLTCYFNPRLREGGDLLSFLPLKQNKQFQSTPPRRRRPISLYRLCNLILFQSTPPRRRRHKNMLLCNQVKNFNPRLREGGDRNIL